MTPSQPRLLIIDDDEQLRSMLAELLRLEHYEVDTAKDGVDGLSAFRRGAYSLVVLDVMMPGKNGFDTLRELRLQSTCPVIMLTARGEADDRITGLEQGADDYIAKPFNPRELLLRVKAILKRSLNTTDHEDIIHVGPLTLDCVRMEASAGDVELSLTGAEFRMLEALSRAYGRAVSRESLNRFALGRELTPYDRALDTHISNLRGKLKKAHDHPVTIRSLRGEGYRLVAD